MKKIPLVRGAMLFALYFLGALLFALSVPAEAQQTKKLYRIAWLSPRIGDESREGAFRQGLRELGYVEGQNIAIESRFAKGQTDILPELAVELVRLNVDVIVASSTNSAVALKKATKTIPIVFVPVTDPVGAGLVLSLARPGGNITGLSNLHPEIGGKRLELLKEVVPRLSRVGVLWVPTTPTGRRQMNEMEVAARALGLQPQPLEVHGPEDFEKGFRSATETRVGALILLSSSMFFSYRAKIAELAAKNRLPVMYTDEEFVHAGGLLSYGANLSDLYRRAAAYVDKILKGAKPADLPVEQPTKFELAINLKTAKQIGLTIPQSVLYRADKVIK